MIFSNRIKKMNVLSMKLHEWYLEAIQYISPENYNQNAEKPYFELNDEQRFIDSHIAQRIIEYFEKEENLE